MQALVIKVKNNVWCQNFTERLGWYVNLRASVMSDLPPPHFMKTSRFPWNLAHKKRDLKVFIWNCDMLNAVWIYVRYDLLYHCKICMWNRIRTPFATLFLCRAVKEWLSLSTVEYGAQKLVNHSSFWKRFSHALFNPPRSD